MNRRDGNHPHQDGHLGILNENNFGGENHFLREFVMMSSIRNEVLRHIILNEPILIRLLTVNGLKSGSSFCSRCSTSNPEWRYDVTTQSLRNKKTFLFRFRSSSRTLRKSFSNIFTIVMWYRLCQNETIT